MSRDEWTGIVHHRVPRMPGRGRRGTDDHPCCRYRARLALGDHRRAHRSGRSGGGDRSLGAGDLGHPAGRIAPLRRRSAPDLRAPVATQGDPASQRPQGLHDEDVAYQTTLAEARGGSRRRGRPWSPTGTHSRCRSRAWCWRASRSRSSRSTFGANQRQHSDGGSGRGGRRGRWWRSRASPSGRRWRECRRTP